MAVSGIPESFITGTLSNGKSTINQASLQKDAQKFSSLVKELQEKTALGIKESSTSGISSSQISKNHRLQGDYTQGFYGSFTSEKDKTSLPSGIAANAKTSSGKTPTIDKTSDLYAQSLELENLLMKIMLSSMRNTIEKTSLSGKENEFASKMYDDMMYDNFSESLTKNASFGLADQIYIELSGQK